MREIYSRLDEIQNQLKNQNGEINTELNAISQIVLSSDVGAAVAQYKSAVNGEINALITALNALGEYLNLKTTQYTTVNQTGVESLNKINNLLSQIEGME